MPKKKLTPKVKAQIKSDYSKLKTQDFTGDALKYLQQVKSLAKARKSKATNFVRVGEQKIPKESALYHIIEIAAKSKNQSVKDFIKENPKTVERFAEKGSDTVVKESDQIEEVIDKLPKRAKIYNKQKEVSRTRAKFLVHSFKSNLMSQAEVYERILHEITFDLKGNLFLNIPLPEEYLEISEEDELLYFIDRKYPSIIYFTNSKKD